MRDFTIVTSLTDENTFFIFRQSGSQIKVSFDENGLIVCNRNLRHDEVTTLKQMYEA